MQQYILRRLILNIFVVLLVATMIFGLLRVDYSNVVGQRAQGCTEAETYDECYQIAKAELGLDKPIYTQYYEFMTNLAQGDLGYSWRERTPVLGEILKRVGPSVELGLLQIMVAIMVALPIGIISAVRQDTWIDYILRFVSIALLGIPAFVLAIFVIMLSARYAEGTFLADLLGPQGEYVTFLEDPIENLKIMFAPAMIGGLGTAAVIMRFLRSQMLEVMRADYVRTAWAKGLKERVIIVRHTLKNALIPVLTLIGILLGAIVSGNVDP